MSAGRAGGVGGVVWAASVGLRSGLTSLAWLGGAASLADNAARRTAWAAATLAGSSSRSHVTGRCTNPGVDGIADWWRSRAVG